MGQQTTAGSGDEPISLAQAVREAAGQISYRQLWRGINAGRIEARQPYGRGGHYRITRAELERVIAPVAPSGAK